MELVNHACVLSHMMSGYTESILASCIIFCQEKYFNELLVDGMCVMVSWHFCEMESSLLFVSESPNYGICTQFYDEC